MKMLKLILIAAICMMVPAGAFGVELLYNGGFEEVNTDGALELIGWTHTRNVEGSLGFLGVNPTEGDWMALMAPQGFSNAVLYQSVDTTGYGAATVSFDYALDSFDIGEESGADILAFFAIGVGSIVLDLFTIDVPEGEGRTDGWYSYLKTFDTLDGGDWFIGFGLANGGVLDFFNPGFPGDYGALTTAFLDNVSFDATPIPEPGSLALLGSGLAGLYFMARSRRAKHGKTPAAL